MSIQPNSPEARRAAQKLLNGFFFLAGLNVLLIIYVFFIADDGKKAQETPPTASLGITKAAEGNEPANYPFTQSDAADTIKKTPASTPTTSRKPETRPTDWAFIETMEANPFGEHDFKLSSDAAESFLSRNDRSASNLIGAWLATNDKRYAEEALRVHGRDRLVLFATFSSTFSTRPDTLERVEAYKASDPNNPLPWLFEAREFFAAGKDDDGIAAIRTALSKPSFYAYQNEQTLAAAAAFADAGYSEAQALMYGSSMLSLPHLEAISTSAKRLIALHQSYANAGEHSKAEDKLQLAYGIFQMLSTPTASRVLFAKLLAAKIERDVLNEEAHYDWLPANPDERRNEIAKLIAESNELIASGRFSKSKNDELVLEYYKRLRTEDELETMRWLKSKAP